MSYAKLCACACVNPLDAKGNYSARSNNMQLVHWPLMVQRGGAGRAEAPSSPLIAAPNATAHPSTASVSITVLLYDGPLLCGFNVAIKRLTCGVLMDGLGLGVMMGK